MLELALFVFSGYSISIYTNNGGTAVGPLVLRCSRTHVWRLTIHERIDRSWSTVFYSEPHQLGRQHPPSTIYQLNMYACQRDRRIWLCVVTT